MKLKDLLLEVTVLTLAGYTAMYVFDKFGTGLGILTSIFIGGIGLSAWLLKPIIPPIRLDNQQPPQHYYKWDVVIMFAIGFICITIAFIFSTMTPADYKDILVTLFSFLAGLISSRVVEQ